MTKPITRCNVCGARATAETTSRPDIALCKSLVCYAGTLEKIKLKLEEAEGCLYDLK